MVSSVEEKNNSSGKLIRAEGFRDRLTKMASRIIMNNIEMSPQVDRIRALHAIDQRAASELNTAIYEYLFTKAMRDI